MDDLEITDVQLRALGERLNARRETQVDPEQGYKVLAGRLADRPPRTWPPVKAQSPWLRRSLAAGGVLLVAGMGYIAIHPEALVRPTANAIAGEAREYRTRRAERATFTLADGTRVTLGPASILRATMTPKHRTIALEGQAYFAVTSDAEAPFTVTTRHSITQVLGTVFTVRAYPSDTVAQVAVAEGRVGTGHTRPDVVVLPGDLAYVMSSGAPVVSQQAKTSDIFGWMQGRMVFDGQAFRDVIPDIERAYDVTIVVRDSSIGQRDLRATLAGDSIAEALDLIAEILCVRYTRQGDTVIFSGVSSR